MNRTIDDDLEGALRELFDRQSRALPVGAREWGEPSVATVAAIEPAPRRRRPALAALAAVAATVAMVAGVATIPPGHGVHVAGSPGTAAPVHFQTEQVTFDASALKIDANGQTFTAAGSNVDLNSDPGDPTYQTLELTWHEHGVEMRLYMYFAADAHDWWATAIRTYNGHAQGDWIEYAGDRFRTPLGSTFIGDVDLRASDGQHGHLTISHLKLQAFRPAPACAQQTGAYAIESNGGAAITMSTDPMTGFSGTVTLFDRATCTPVRTTGRFRYTFTSSAPKLVAVLPLACGAGLSAEYCDTHSYFDLSAKSAGTATIHVTATDVATGATVAQTDVRVTAKG
jgi:hypothetical protein